MIHGAFCCAVLNKSRTLDAPTPTNISTKSEPDNEKNGTFASPATALAKSVFPVPGGPTRSAPFGNLAPICTYFCGLCKKSTISVNDSFASSSPATSANVTPVARLILVAVFAFPIPIMPPEPPPIRRIKNPIRIQINANGKMYIKINSSIAEPELSSVPVYSTPASFSIGSKFESGRYGV